MVSMFDTIQPFYASVQHSNAPLWIPMLLCASFQKVRKRENPRLRVAPSLEGGFTAKETTQQCLLGLLNISSTISLDLWNPAPTCCIFRPSTKHSKFNHQVLLLHSKVSSDHAWPSEVFQNLWECFSNIILNNSTTFDTILSFSKQFNSFYIIYKYYEFLVMFTLSSWIYFFPTGPPVPLTFLFKVHFPQTPLFFPHNTFKRLQYCMQHVVEFRVSPQCTKMGQGLFSE